MVGEHILHSRNMVTEEAAVGSDSHNFYVLMRKPEKGYMHKTRNLGIQDTHKRQGKNVLMLKGVYI